MEIMTTLRVRKEIIDYLKRELIGPAPGYPAVQLNKEEILRSQDPPRLRYSAGILFPTRSEQSEQLDAEKSALEDIEASPGEEADSKGSRNESELADSGSP